jgi:hypothetical protein
MSEGYDFNKREDFDYSHSFDYLGGVGLGKAEVQAEKKRLSELGKYDLDPVDPPEGPAAQEVIRLAENVHKSSQRDSLLQKIAEMKDSRTEFVWNKSHRLHPYYVWALHCLDREVPNWTSIRKGNQKPKSKHTEPKVTRTLEVRIGDWVEVSDVQARPELNGKRGCVKSRTPNNRFEVEFPDIAQTVSLAASKCHRSETSGVSATPEGQLPKGLKVEVTNLQSEEGKLLNGSIGFVVEYNNYSKRYTVRLDQTTKALKKENLHVCLPPGWSEHIDPSTGETFYKEIGGTGKTSWEHPILGKRKRKPVETEFVAEPEDVEEDGNEQHDEDFNRAEFVAEESKRLRLDKKRSQASPELVRKLLNLVRSQFGLGEPNPNFPLFVGTGRVLLETLDGCNSADRPGKLVIGLELIFQDLCNLKFNKKQLIGFAEHLDEILEGKSFTPRMEDWIIAALRISIPISFTVF